MINTQFTLSIFEKIVNWIHAVPNIRHNTLKKTLSSEDSNRYIVFDTRILEEFETSHIRNAIQLDPGITVDDYNKNFAGRIKNKHLVFYCSIGYRSSVSLKRLKKVSLEAGALSLHNLQGGIFRWYNEAHPVVDEKGITNDIHPYASFWGFLVKKRD